MSTKKRKDAAYESYVSLAKKVLYSNGYDGLGIRRDVFTGDLVYFDAKKQCWIPVMNALGRLRSYAAEFNQQPGDYSFRLSLIEDHVERLEQETSLRFIPDIPEWDGVDRIDTMGRCLLLKEHMGLEPEHTIELLKDWFCKAWKRLWEPKVRNRMLVLCGKQHMGKDWFIQRLCEGAGQWFIDMPVGKNVSDKDVDLAVSSGMFIRISEFEKTSVWDASKLKDLIDKSFVSPRTPYARRNEKRWCRASFVGNSNTSDIFRDHTGATKFIVLDVEHIEYRYDNTEQASLQLLAQAKKLASEDYKSSKETERRLAEYLNSKIPDDPIEEIKLTWFNLLNDQPVLTNGKTYLTMQESIHLLEKLAQYYGTTVKNVQAKLKAAGLAIRTNTARGYKVRLDA